MAKLVFNSLPLRLRSLLKLQTRIKLVPFVNYTIRLYNSNKNNANHPTWGLPLHANHYCDFSLEIVNELKLISSAFEKSFVRGRLYLNIVIDVASQGKYLPRVNKKF